MLEFYTEVLEFCTEVLQFYTEVLELYTEVLEFYTEELEFCTEVLESYTEGKRLNPPAASYSESSSSGDRIEELMYWGVIKGCVGGL